MKKTIFLITIIICISLPGIFEFFKPGYFVTHDGAGHIARMEEFHLALSEGHIPPRMSKNFMYGYGYYFFNFNYPAVYWIGEALVRFGLSFTNVIKAISIISFSGSGIAMYLWQRRHTGVLAAFISSVFYMYAPYRFLAIYVRGTIAEDFALLVIPIVFLLTEKAVSQAPNKGYISYILASLAYALLILSHNIVALIFSIFLFCYFCFLSFGNALVRSLYRMLLVILFGLLLSSFFWIPAVFEKQYVLIDSTLTRDYKIHFIYPFQLIMNNWGFGYSVEGPNDGLSFQIGIGTIIIILLSLSVPVLEKIKKNDKYVQIYFWIGMISLAVFLMTHTSMSIWNNLTILKYVQFPWRFLTWIVFSSSVLAGILIRYLQITHHVKRFVYIVVGLLTAFQIFVNSSYWKPTGRYDAVVAVGDRPFPGSGTVTAMEHVPVWLDPIPTGVPAERVEIIGNGTVDIKYWKTSEHAYSVDSANSVLVVENTAYFPGWTVYVDGVKADSSYMSPGYSGRITFPLENGKHTIETVFHETHLRSIANVITVISFLLAIVIPVFGWIKKRVQKRTC